MGWLLTVVSSSFGKGRIDMSQGKGWLTGYWDWECCVRLGFVERAFSGRVVTAVGPHGAGKSGKTVFPLFQAQTRQ